MQLLHRCLIDLFSQQCCLAVYSSTDRPFGSSPLTWQAVRTGWLPFKWLLLRLQRRTTFRQPMGHLGHLARIRGHGCNVQLLQAFHQRLLLLLLLPLPLLLLLPLQLLLLTSNLLLQPPCTCFQ